MAETVTWGSPSLELQPWRWYSVMARSGSSAAPGAQTKRTPKAKHQVRQNFMANQRGQGIMP
jgi:hypothetical protein